MYRCCLEGDSEGICGVANSDEVECSDQYEGLLKHKTCIRDSLQCGTEHIFIVNNSMQAGTTDFFKQPTTCLYRLRTYEKE